MNTEETIKNAETKPDGYTLLSTGWHSAKDRPLFTKDERGKKEKALEAGLQQALKLIK
jgi:hypothetical protein